jgi:predicted MFS family arabinose efflux permease
MTTRAAYQPRHAPRLFGRIVLLCTYVILVIGIFSLGSALPEIHQAFIGQPNAARDTQLVGAAAGFGFAVTSLAIGRSVARLGYRPVLVAALLVFSIAGTGAVLFHDLPLIVFSRAIVGAATALIVNASLVAIGAIIPEADRKRFFGLQTFLGSLAGVALYPISGMLAGLDWRLPFTLDLLGLVLIPMALTLPAATVIAEEQPRKSSTIGRLGSRLTLTAVLLGVVMFILSAFGSLYLAGKGVHSALLLSFPATTSAIGSMMGALGYIALQKRLGLNGALVTALFAVAFGLSFAALSAGVLSLSAAFLLAGMGTAVFSPSLNEAAIRAAPGDPGRTLGVANGLFYGSLIVFPLIVTAMLRICGGPSRVILCFALSALVLAILFAMRPWQAEPGLDGA